MSYRIENIVPRAERLAIIAEGVKTSKKPEESLHDFRGETRSLKVVRLPINLPVYRIENCRTFSAQQTYLSRHGEDKDFFIKGQELSSVQQIQHEILMDLLEPTSESVVSIKKVLQKEGQRESLLINNSGVVVNGNRRLCAMREILSQNAEAGKKFEYVNCAVLPVETNASDIEDIEATLQARPNTKLEYDWISDAYLIKRQNEKGWSTKKIADHLQRPETEIKSVLDSFIEADLYLKAWINKPGEYEYVRDGHQVFGDLPKLTKKQDPETKEVSRAIAWTIFENRELVSGRIYRLNDAFGKHTSAVMDLLSDEIETSSSSELGSEDDSIVFDIDSDEQGENSKHRSIYERLRNGRGNKSVFDSLIEACETTLEAEKGKKNKNAALLTIKLVNTKLAGVNVNSAGKETFPAIKGQIATIRTTLDNIEKKIIKREQKK